MEADGCTEQEARDKVWMMDIDGLLTEGRKVGNLDGHKKWYAKVHSDVKSLIDVVKEIKPTVLIGNFYTRSVHKILIKILSILSWI